jgi:hypothetical protein
LHSIISRIKSLFVLGHCAVCHGLFPGNKLFFCHLLFFFSGSHRRETLVCRTPVLIPNEKPVIFFFFLFFLKNANSNPTVETTTKTCDSNATYGVSCSESLPRLSSEVCFVARGGSGDPEAHAMYGVDVESVMFLQCPFLDLLILTNRALAKNFCC